MAESRISQKRSGGGSTPIEVANYSALPPVGTAPGTTYIVLASQGTYWLPGSLGGTYYPKGYYYDATTEYIYSETPYQATQVEVDAGTNDDKFVTPKTYIQGLVNWFTNARLLSVLGYTPVPNTRTINGLDLSEDRTLTASNVGAIENSSDAVLNALGWWQICEKTAGNNSSGTSITISKSIQIDEITDILNIEKVTFTKTGTAGTFTGRVYLSEVDNNIGGSAILLATYTSGNTANIYLPIKRTFEIIGTNIVCISPSASQPTDITLSSSTMLSTTILTGSPLYLIFAAQCANGGDTARFESAYIKNF